MPAYPRPRGGNGPPDCAGGLPSHGRSLALVGFDGGLQVIVLLAAEAADIVELFQAFLGLCQVAGLQEKFAQIFVGAAMVRIDGQSLPIGAERLIELLQFTLA